MTDPRVLRGRLDPLGKVSALEMATNDWSDRVTSSETEANND